MKKYILAMLVLALSVINVAYARDYLAPKRVTIPFFNEPILSDKHNGLLFAYDMSGTPAMQIKCDYVNDYKGVAEFRVDGQLVDSGLNTTTIFTAKGEDSYDNQQVSIIHTDKTGSIRVKDFEHQGKIGSLSCQYMLDDSPLYK